MSKNKIEILVPCQPFKPNGDANKAIASLMPTSANFSKVNAQPDLLFMRSLLVSTGENKNDDVFLPEEMWGARSTPVLKPVDWEHNTGRELTPQEQAENPGKVVVDNQTIGVMYNAYTVDENDAIIDEARASANDFEIPKNFHIIDEAVIWKALYPTVAKRIEEGAANGTLFVSMEAWFTDYYYLVGSKVVARNEETAFLDGSLRANGGTGSYGGQRVRRALRNITFGGKGIVARPANEPSVITHVSHEPMGSNADVINKVIAKNIICDIRSTQAATPRKDMKMSNDNAEKQVSLELYAKVNEENVDLRAESKVKDAELAKANEKVETLKVEQESVVSAFTKGAETIEELIPGFSAQIADAHPENFFGVLATMIENEQAVKADLEKRIAEALAKINELELGIRTAAREAKVDTLLGIAEMHEDEDKAKKAKEKKEKMMAAVQDLSDDQFNALYEVWAEQKAEADEMKRGSMSVESGSDVDRGAAKDQPTSATMHEDKMEKDEEDEEDEKTKGGPMKKGGASEDIARQVLAGLLQSRASEADIDIEEVLKGVAEHQEPTDEENLMALLDGVQASEKAPSAGEEAPQGVDLRSSFGGLVSTMLGRDDEESN